MPDWFYRTVAQKALFSLPGETGRALALGVIGALGKSVAGRRVIGFMGHMEPDPSLAVDVAGDRFLSPVGLGWRVDPARKATRALAQFGVGCIEVLDTGFRDTRRDGRDALVDGEWIPASLSGGAEETVLLKRSRGVDGNETLQLPSGAELPVYAIDHPPFARRGASEAGAVLQIGSPVGNGRWKVPNGLPSEAAERVSQWRRALPEGAALVVTGGAGEPEDVLKLIDAGADLALIDTGLIFQGPGLVKRCNQALTRRRSTGAQSVGTSVPLFQQAWVWAAAIGISLFVGGIAALWLAATRVLLPYDEHFLGLSAAELQQRLPLLFDFMAHDRATLAGSMLGLGWMYSKIAVHGVRGGEHGARTAVAASALVGFATFFAFFGFGYFDTLHAFVALALMQLTIQVLVGSEGGSAQPVKAVIDNEDSAWRRAQWAQLLWIVHSVGLLGAGLTILTIGMTSVFVSEDLSFLCMTADQARSLDARLIGVVAHDRATLGGMLLASGVAMLLTTLWLFRRGARWIWSAILGLGVPAYAAAIGIHFWVGYIDWRHLAPAFAGLLLWAAGLFLSRRYLLDPSANP